MPAVDVSVFPFGKQLSWISALLLQAANRDCRHANAATALCVSPGRWEWLSDSPSLLAPCAGAVSYYSQFGRVMGFTSAAGRCFRTILDQHLDLLLWPNGVKARSGFGIRILVCCSYLCICEDMGPGDWLIAAISSSAHAPATLSVPCRETESWP